MGWIYKVVQIWPGLFVCKQVTVCPGHIWTILYLIQDRANESHCDHSKEPVGSEKGKEFLN
jgi:hypothetical protein